MKKIEREKERETKRERKREREGQRDRLREVGLEREIKQETTWPKYWNFILFNVHNDTSIGGLLHSAVIPLKFKLQIESQFSAFV
jgi:hypothetical protein